MHFRKPLVLTMVKTDATGAPSAAAPGASSADATGASSANAASSVQEVQIIQPKLKTKIMKTKEIIIIQILVQYQLHLQ